MESSSVSAMRFDKLLTLGPSVVGARWNSLKACHAAGTGGETPSGAVPMPTVANNWSTGAQGSSAASCTAWVAGGRHADVLLGKRSGHHRGRIRAHRGSRQGSEHESQPTCCVGGKICGHNAASAGGSTKAAGTWVVVPSGPTISTAMLSPREGQPAMAG